MSGGSGQSGKSDGFGALVNEVKLMDLVEELKVVKMT